MIVPSGKKEALNLAVPENEAGGIGVGGGVGVGVSVGVGVGWEHEATSIPSRSTNKAIGMAFGF